MDWTTKLGVLALGLAVTAGVSVAGKKAKDCWRTEEPAQIVGDTTATDQGWNVTPLVTIGEQNGDGDDVNLEELGYRPVGILDGIGAWKWTRNTTRVLVNNELGSTLGYAYTLANGTSMTGARVTYFDIDRKSRKVCGAGLAFDRVFDRAGKVVTSATQINEGSSTTEGFGRLCSAHGFAKGEWGFRDDIFMTGEEGSDGQECALDVRNGDLYVAPMMGRAAWENVTAMENCRSDKIVILVGDDTTGAPLWLYIGEKGAAPDSGDYVPPSFLKRNGLGLGCLFVWVSDDGDADPRDFKGTGATRKGKFRKITHFDPSKAGDSGWDGLGFASQATQVSRAKDVGAFLFSRPEDVTTNPRDGTQAVLNSTGNSGYASGADSWGTTYLVDLDDCDLEEQLDRDLAKIDGIGAKLTILYDGDDAGDGQFAGPDYGLRSPDNADWAHDGNVYLQEDRSIGGFGGDSGAEASVWSLNPRTGKLTRILEMDRSSVPTGQSDPKPGDIGNWESSGVLDVTNLFKTKRGETLLILTVQAHSLSGGGLAQNASQASDLAEGGQLVLASKVSRRHRDKDCDDDDRDHEGDDD